MDSTIVIRRHDPSEGPGTLWWAESEAGFVGGHDNLNELTRSAAEWAEDAGIEPRFRLEMEAASSDSQAVIVAPRAPSRAMSAHACEPASPPERGMGHTQERGAASSQATGEMGRGEPATSAAVSDLRPYLVPA